jgi:acetyl-CoA carboxylase biotin carboxyl carrier protein
MNIKEIKEMISLMNENNLSELEIEQEGTKIRLKKTTSAQFEVLTTQSSGAVSREFIDTKKQETVSAAQPQNLKPASNLIEIKAPMVGTFYRAPSPEAPPYAEVGQTVTTGQVICIIEAMKLMNEIKSEHNGKIVEIIANNAEPVEYGQVIMKIEPNA